ncbi:hypothetical protein DYQ86_17890 [Acidobacteria bacterium AB60]|nr:hypothetical protein DYQ86_17890 [Acidobacteria bacterium AB60]
MTPERWKQIRVVFEKAESLSPANLNSFLNEACASDLDLRGQVESLLRARSDAGTGFMEDPAVNLLGEAGAAVAIASRIGRRVGTYRVVSEIGSGGMGQVYRAVRIDGQFDQQVAIKFVRAGIDSAFVISRFQHERQILATLNHPNIGHLLDGGATEDGVPYLVMELIEGERIDRYCQKNHLSVSDRLRLFLQVCEAVEHAHQRLVIHRDIKPGNILVTGDGTPKLLDFGIAKILDPSVAPEETVASSMTPEYASPEQIFGEPITTGTDIYSMGMVLYRLLTGRSPYRQGNTAPAYWAHAHVAAEPRRPSHAVVSQDPIKSEEELTDPVLNPSEPNPARLRRKLSGDLDGILLKALRREPERRYGTIRQFAEDIERHLNGLPVSAARGSWIYTSRKFVSRHRAAVAASALLVLALIAGIGATGRQARIARAERARAQKRFDDVRTFSSALIFDVHDALQDIPGTTPALNLLLDRAVQYLDRISADAQGDPDLQRELASAYQRLATVQGDSTTSNLGQVSASKISYRKATALFEAVARANPASAADQLSVAQIYRQQAMSDIYYPEGRPEVGNALAITDRLMRTDGQNPQVQIERAIEQQVFAAILDIDGERSRSAEVYRESLALVLSVAEHDPSYKNIAERVAKSKVLLGFELAHTSMLDEGQEMIKAGVLAYDEALKKAARPETRRDEAASRYRLGYVEALRGDLSHAIGTFTHIREDETPLAKADPQNVTLQVDLLSTDFELQRILILKGRFREAEAGIERVMAGFHALHAEEDSGPGMGVLYAWLGEAQYSAGDFGPALESFRRSMEELVKDSADRDTQCGIVTVNSRIGDTLLKLGRADEAETAYKAALSKLDQESAMQHSDMPSLLALRAAHHGMAEYWIFSASQHAGPRNQLLAKSCEELSRAEKLNELISFTLVFNPANFPLIRDSRTATSCPPTRAR